MAGKARVKARVLSTRRCPEAGASWAGSWGPSFLTEAQPEALGSLRMVWVGGRAPPGNLHPEQGPCWPTVDRLVRGGRTQGRAPPGNLYPERGPCWPTVDRVVRGGRTQGTFISSTGPESPRPCPFILTSSLVAIGRVGHPLPPKEPRSFVAWAWTGCAATDGHPKPQPPRVCIPGHKVKEKQN